MTFEKIKELLTVELHDRIEKSSDKIKDEESLNHFVRWSLNKQDTYKGDFETQKQKALNLYAKRLTKEYNKTLAFINSVAEVGEFNSLTVTIEWKKSRMWGSNPRAYTNYGFIGESVGGCGYDKLSTAHAQALNSHLPLLKVLWLKEEERLKKLDKSEMSGEDKEKYLSRRAYIGYGSGYGILPKFEGGVGVESHRSIIKELGLNFNWVTNAPNTDVTIISK